MKVFEQGYEEGWNQAEEEFKDLTVNDFARLCFLLSEDHTIDHKDAGFLIYKLHHKLNQDKFKEKSNE